MDFLKENWVKLTIAIVSFVVAIFFALSLVVDVMGLTELERAARMGMYTPMLLSTLAGLLFFTMVTVYCVLKMLGKEKWGKFEMLGVGALNLILLVVASIIAGGSDWATFIGAHPGFASHTETAGTFMTIAVFAIFPLVFGLKRVFCKEEK